MRARAATVKAFIERHQAWLAALGIVLLLASGVRGQIEASELHASQRAQASQQIQIHATQAQIHATQAQLRALVASTTRNRVANVATWCGAISRLGNALTLYVAGFHGDGVPAFSVPKLDCLAIEKRTAESNK